MVRRLIDQNRQRELRRQTLLLERIERPLERRLRSEISAAMAEMIRVWELTGIVPAVQDHQTRLASIYQAMAIAAVTAFGARVMDAGMGKAAPYTLDGGASFALARGAGVQVETKDFAATMTRLALSYVGQELIRRRITDVAETTRSQIVSAVARGYADGLGQNEIARTIRPLVPQMAGYRARMIARTETHGAANYGSTAAADETGLRLQKEWIAAADERTRETHALADRQVVGKDEAFDIGGASGMYPGDPSLPAEESINCRCCIGYIVID
jgi:phage baseplate assembly protein W